MSGAGVTTAPREDIDPILAVVLGKKIEAIAKEMSLVLERTARSPLFQVKDFCTAVLDERARILSQEEGLPQMAYAIVHSLEHLIEFFGDDIGPGDIFIQNDPYYGGNHAPDTCIFMPVFVDGEIHFWGAAKGHLADLGSAVMGGYNPQATDIWQENFRIPPLRLYDRGALRTDVWNLLHANTRLPHFVLGDIQASIGACRTGGLRLEALATEQGVGILKDHLDFLLDATERRMRTELAQIPDGTYTSEVVYRCDDGSESIDVTAKLAITTDGGHISVDYAGSSPQTPYYYNCAYGTTFAAVVAVVLMLVDPDLPHNDGVLRCIDVIVPEGSFLNCTFPSPCVQGNFTSSDVAGDSIFLALSEVLPDRVCAGWSRNESHMIKGLDPRTGERFYGPPLLANKGGAGATSENDGWSFIGLIACGGGYAANDYEMFEIQNPVRIAHHEYWCDSAGPGTYRGGLGIRFRYTLEAPETEVTTYGEDWAPAFGLFGGGQSSLNQYRVQTPGEAMRRLAPNTTSRFGAGTVIEADNAGGGGFGPPHRRAAETVRDDARNGFVSLETAAEVFGVVVDPETFEIDHDATARRREELEHASLPA